MFSYEANVYRLHRVYPELNIRHSEFLYQIIHLLNSNFAIPALQFYLFFVSVLLLIAHQCNHNNLQRSLTEYYLLNNILVLEIDSL